MTGSAQPHAKGLSPFQHFFKKEKSLWELGRNLLFPLFMFVIFVLFCQLFSVIWLFLLKWWIGGFSPATFVIFIEACYFRLFFLNNAKEDLFCLVFHSQGNKMFDFRCFCDHVQTWLYLSNRSVIDRSCDVTIIINYRENWFYYIQ